MNVKEKLQALLAASNNTTGETDTTLTDAVQSLIDGYGQGGSGLDFAFGTYTTISSGHPPLTVQHNLGTKNVVGLLWVTNDVNIIQTVPYYEFIEMVYVPWNLGGVKFFIDGEEIQAQEHKNFMTFSFNKSSSDVNRRAYYLDSEQTENTLQFGKYYVEGWSAPNTYVWVVISLEGLL